MSGAAVDVLVFLAERGCLTGGVMVEVLEQHINECHAIVDSAGIPRGPSDAPLSLKDRLELLVGR